MKRVVVLGGGFAGISAAIELQKSKKFRVTLVSDRDYLYIYPLSIWVPVHQAEFDKIRVPLSEISRSFPFEVIVNKVEEIRASSHEVVCTDRTLSYDYLVVAFGADKMKHKGIENTLSICGRPEVSVEIRKRVDSLVENGSGSIAVGFGGNPKDSSRERGSLRFPQREAGFCHPSAGTGPLDEKRLGSIYQAYEKGTLPQAARAMIQKSILFLPFRMAG